VVAAAAGVGTATAYTYFSSKEHLVAEIFWRRLVSGSSPASDDPVPLSGSSPSSAKSPCSSPTNRNSLARSPALCSAATPMWRICARIGAEIRKRLLGALGPDADPDVVESLELLYAGALVRAGMGYASYSEIADRLEKSALLILK
jgi:hypothetical protein